MGKFTQKEQNSNSQASLLKKSHILSQTITTKCDKLQSWVIAHVFVSSTSTSTVDWIIFEASASSSTVDL